MYMEEAYLYFTFNVFPWDERFWAEFPWDERFSAVFPWDERFSARIVGRTV